MGFDNMGSDRVEPDWFIDLEWFQPNKRSFVALTRNCLCPKCRRRLKVKKGEVMTADLLQTIKDCCSGESGFITTDLPVLESVFRIFLANSNQPLSLAELARQLTELRGGRPVPVKVLSRLLRSDRYYGLRQVPN